MPKTSRKAPKQPRADSQLSGLAGELFVAAELLKRGMQTSLTLGNAKAVDLFAVHPTSGKAFSIQVKALRARNYFPINATRIQANCVYAFVVLNKPGTPPDYFLVPGERLSNDPDRFGKWFRNEKFPGIHPKDLEAYRDNWQIFEA